VVDTIEQNHGGVDVLINNASFGMYGAMEDTSIEDARYQFEVNVEMISRPNVLIIYPSRSPIARSAASLHRVPWGGFPDVNGTISRLRLLVLRPAALRCLRSAVPPLCSSSFPRLGTIPQGPGLLLPRRPHRLFTMEKARSPRFLGAPCLNAPLFDPGGPLAPGHFGTNDAAFR